MPGKTYTYRVEAVDHAGNVSPSKTVTYQNPSDCGYQTTPKRIRFATLIVEPNDASATPINPTDIAQMITGVGGEFNSSGIVQYLDEVSTGPIF